LVHLRHGPSVETLGYSQPSLRDDDDQELAALGRPGLNYFLNRPPYAGTRIFFTASSTTPRAVTPEKRAYYDLERLWRHAASVPLPPEDHPAEAGS